MAGYTKERRAEASTTHGMTGARIYRIWGDMLSRCRNPNDTCYGRYGGKGVTVCRRWERFDMFYKDMKAGYSETLTLDRIDSTKGYGPYNCRWADRTQQSRNRGNNIVGVVDGERMVLSEAVEKYGVVQYHTAKSRVQTLGWDFAKAVTTPSRRR